VHQPVGSFAALDITLATLEKMVLMLVATLGIIAPAAVATNPAISAYSMRSCPFVLRHSDCSLMTARVI
jgi:hypothetical protein